jgi:hypothetical protein
MKKKLLVFTFLLTSSVVLLPAQSLAAAPADPAGVGKTSPPQIRIQVGRRNRGRHYGWWRGRRVGRYYRNEDQYGRRVGRYNRGTLVRQVYWMNGRRYTRWVRSY